MGGVSWPWPTYHAGAVTEWEYEQLATAWQIDGVLDVPGALALDVSVDTSTRSWSVEPGQAHIRARLYTLADTDERSGVLSPNTGAADRIDTIVIRVDRAAETITTTAVEGTPGGGRPALARDDTSTGLWDLPLSDVIVRPDGTASKSQGRRVWLLPQPFSQWESDAPLHYTPLSGTERYLYGPGTWQTWDGTRWVDRSGRSETTIGVASDRWEIGGDNLVVKARNGYASVRGSVIRRKERWNLFQANYYTHICTVPADYWPAEYRFITPYATNGPVRLHIRPGSGEIHVLNGPEIRIGDEVYIDHVWEIAVT